MASVGRAWSILKGRATGNVGEAATFLESLSPAEMKERNKAESRARGGKFRKTMRLGERLRKRVIRGPT